MYGTVKYTDDTRDSRKEKLEWKIRRDTIGYSMPRIHWILRHLTLRSFPQLKSNLHGKRFAQNQILKSHGLVMGSTTQEMLTNPGRVFEKLCRSPNRWRYSPLTSPKVLRISLHDETLIAVKLVSLIRIP